MTQSEARLYVYLLLTWIACSSLMAAQSGVGSGGPATEAMVVLAAPDAPDASSTSHAAGLPNAPEPVASGRSNRSHMKAMYQTHMRPFSHVAAAVNVSVEGAGVDLATPLSNRWNLRVGVSYLDVGLHATVQEGAAAASDFGATLGPDAISVALRPRFFAASTSLDWFPWYGSFRISPGLTLYNGNRGTAVATVAGGETISVGDGNYVSDPADPIQAHASVDLGHRVAPKLTVGWGNMLPRSGEHFSFPFEVGFEYVGRPTLQLTLAGSACDANDNCGPINTDSSTEANLLQEQRDVTKDLAPLRFYPILSTGVSYRF